MRPIVLSESEARRRIDTLPRGVEPRIRWGGFDVPGEIAAANVLCVGALGAGKTRMHRELMRSLVPTITPESDRRVLICDTKGDLVSELHEMGPSAEVLIFNPLDKRSIAWDVATDAQTAVEVRDFVEALFPADDRGTGGFFVDAARLIVGGVIDSFNRIHRRNWDLRRLVLVTRSRPRLERVLAGSNLVEQYFSGSDTFANIQNVIANAMEGLKPIAAAWNHTDRKISLRQWAAKGRSILVLGPGCEKDGSVQVVNRAAFSIIAKVVLAGLESPGLSRLWFFCDDLPAAGRLDSLLAMLNLRSKGVRCVLGVQALEGLTSAYGDRQTAMEIAARCATVSWLRLASAETAEWASKRTGGVIPPADFLDLPQAGAGDVHGVHLIRGVEGIFKCTAHYEFPKTNPADDFQPRPDSQFDLRPWSEDDDRWLEGGQP